MVALLSVGSEGKPRGELVGEEGARELVRVGEEGKGGLARFFESGKGEKPLEVFGKGGLPPTPSGVSLREGADKYHLTEENAYPEQYVSCVCWCFASIANLNLDIHAELSSR